MQLVLHNYNSKACYINIYIGHLYLTVNVNKCTPVCQYGLNQTFFSKPACCYLLHDIKSLCKKKRVGFVYLDKHYRKLGALTAMTKYNIRNDRKHHTSCGVRVICCNLAIWLVKHIAVVTCAKPTISWVVICLETSVTLVIIKHLSKYQVTLF